MILPKKQMTEEDIKLHYITPAIVKVMVEELYHDGDEDYRREDQPAR